jgi:succinyl-CoA synthetase beta subunit
MNLHEYQAKAVLRDYGIVDATGRGGERRRPVRGAVAELGGDAWVAKAQIHAGGRGKAGGVKLVARADELGRRRPLLGSRLTTYQNAPDGQPVNQLLIEETLPIARELYLSITVDRAAERIGFVASAAGGMEIEEVARTTPEKILKEWVNPVTGFMDYQGATWPSAWPGGRSGRRLRQAGEDLLPVFLEKDLALLEINPLVVTSDGKCPAPGLQDGRGGQRPLPPEGPGGHRRFLQIDPKEAEAHAHEVNYIALNGNIGCMVNGAGLAMATMDLIKLSGGMPANFLDVGGGATAAPSVAEAFKIILADPNVKAVLINIFGGIVRCDLIAEGIITR